MSMNHKKQNQDYLIHLNKIHQKFKSLIESEEASPQKSPTKFKNLINKLMNELVCLKEENVKNLALLNASESQKNNTLEKRVLGLDVNSKLKKEAKALDKAIAKVNQAEKYCESAMSKAKVELANAELACLQAVKAKAELDEVIHQ